MLATDPNRRGGCRSVIGWSVTSSILLIGLVVFFPALMDVLTPFLGSLIGLAIFVLFFGVLGWALLAGLIEASRSRRLTSLLPAAIALSALAAVYLLPIRQWLVGYDYWAGLSAREQVVRAIESNRLQEAGLALAESDAQKGIELIRLPDRYSHLSYAKSPVVVLRDGSTLAVLFFRYRDSEGTFDGFVYSSSNLVPLDRDPYRGVRKISRLQEHWYWVDSWYHGLNPTPTP